MKKYFFYAAAAIAMLASCQKSELKSEQTPVVDDGKPVAIQIGVNAPSFDVAVTKAAVDEWNNTPVHIYGIQRGSKGVVDGAKYDFDKGLLIDENTTVEDSKTDLKLYSDDANSVYYYYTEGETYDFYGYHIGGELAEDVVVTKEDDAISFPYTIDGATDLMVATTNKAKDILADTSTDGVTEGDVYSAWAARRSVHPTLVFEHALTRFNFIVRGMNDASEELTVTGIKMNDLATTGTFTVAGDNLGFVTTSNADASLSLAMTEEEQVKKGNTNYVNFDASGSYPCLMIAPNLANINVEVSMKHDNIEKVNPYIISVNASQVLKDGVAAGITTFAAGTAYNIYVNVYGPEEIRIKAELTEWLRGGQYTYDPDQDRPGVQATSVTAERTVADNVINYVVTYTTDITKLEGAVAKTQPDVTAEAGPEGPWTSLVTKASTGISFTVPEGDNAGDYKLYVRYKTAESKEWTVMEAMPAFKIAKSYLVTDKASFDTLPAGYREEHPWDDATTEATLPWLAVEFTPGATISGTAQCGNFTYEIEEATSTIGLLTLSAEEMGLTSLTGGEWTITLNGVRTKITVFNINEAYYICDEQSYNRLPVEYRQQYGDWDYYWAGQQNAEKDPDNHADFNAIPWLAIEFTPGATVSGTVVRGDFTHNITESKSTIGLITLSAKQMGLDNLEGEWTVTLNDVEAKISVPVTSTEQE